MNNKDLGRRLFDAIEKGDADTIRSVCAADFVGTQNGGPTMDLRGLIAFAQGSTSVVKDFRYENIVAQDTPDGFVEEHDVVGTLPDGEAMRMRVCVVASVQFERITDLREYADSFPARGLFKALQAAGSA